MGIDYTDGTKEDFIEMCPCHEETAGHPVKLKGWGLFKGIKIEEEDIEEAKLSLFPEGGE